ncbi:MAG TPA: glycine cleavage system protein H [Verrucomicrobiales bacterium]|nr:glycine cleavage system protein H [Verrucomicrobiales bacterium]
MASGASKTLFFKKSNFVTHLPADYRYSPTHYWLAAQPDGSWRIGFTKFAVRMLGELVEHGFEIEPGKAIQPGDILGWVEGFKAISDVYGIVEGRFIAANETLKTQLKALGNKPYSDGWLYQAAGMPDANCLDVHGYAAHLDRTIAMILEKQKSQENT